MAIVTIRTHASQATDVLIRDLGIVIPAGGAVQTFTRLAEIQKIMLSKDLVTLCTDLAFSPDSTLTLGNGSFEYGSNGGNPVSQLNFLTGGIETRVVSSTSSTTTSSTTDVLMTGMQITTILSGVYIVVFSATVGANAAGNDVFISLYVDGSQKSGSERRIDLMNSANYRTNASLFWVEKVTGNNQTFEIRWRTVASSTATVENRTMIIGWMNPALGNTIS